MDNAGSELAQQGLAIAAYPTASGYRLKALKGMGAEKTSAAGPPRKGGEEPEDLLSAVVWLLITPDNSCTVITGKSEMGQGVCTSLPMILAEELRADWEQIRFKMSPAGREYKDPVWGVQTTGGSTSVRHMFEPLRKAGAAAREMLMKTAARRWEVPVKECEAAGGIVRNRRTGQKFSYGELAIEASGLPVPSSPSIGGKETRFIGKALPRLDITEKVNGTAVFGLDVFLDGMLYASVARPPVFGAWVVSYDREAALAVPGVHRVVEIAGGIAVCADRIDAAWKGRRALSVEWDRGTHPDLDNDSLESDFTGYLERVGVVAGQRGNAAASLKSSSRKVEATYFLPYLAHAAIEPMNCTASVCPDSCEIWVPTQDQSDVIRSAAELTALDTDRIYVHTTYLGGGFGRRLEVDYAVEAVELSKATGKPVKLIWTREEDFRNDFFRPACCCSMKGGLDSKGRFTSWSQKIVVPSIFSRVSPEAVKKGVDPAAVEGLADTEYEVPNFQTRYVRMDNPIPVGFWRSVGHSHNAFVVESFMDEMAAAAGRDPLEFRIGLLEGHQRTITVLRLAAEKSGWGNKLPGGLGRGIAQHFSYGSFVAQVAEVAVDEDSGRISVKRVVCAIDCGTLINPAIAEAQIKGGIVFGLSALLKEEVLFGSGGVDSLNFNRYHIARMSGTPEIDVFFVGSDEEPGGIGEVAVPPIAPAVANAVFDCAGVRLRSLPLKPGKVLEALKRRK